LLASLPARPPQREVVRMGYVLADRRQPVAGSRATPLAGLEKAH
jgi:hypothetical protein